MSELLEKLETTESLPLPTVGSWSAAAHRFDQKQKDAIAASALSGRPLLIRGEPGLGKSQVARAIAALMNWYLVTAVLRARTEIEDLQYRVDHVRRLSESRLPATQLGSADDPLWIGNFVDPGPLWRAFEWYGQEELMADADRPCLEHEKGYYDAKDGCVLLIDEIDKTHPDVPNALLEALNTGSFKVNETNRIVGDPTRKNNLFVVVTSNGERTLPDAFLRRCATLTLSLDNEPKQELRDVVSTHMKNGFLAGIDDPIIGRAIDLVLDWRGKIRKDEYKPGTSELLDLLRVIGQEILRGKLDEAKVMDRLDIMAGYLVRKTHRTDNLAG